MKHLFSALTLTLLFGVAQAQTPVACTANLAVVPSLCAAFTTVNNNFNALSAVASAIYPSVALVATSNLTLSGAQTIDGSAGTVGTTLVLATAQSTASQNGPWIMQTGAWTRPAWYPSGGTTQAIQFGTTLVRLGTTYQGTTWRQTAAAPITIDTTATTWAITPLALNANTVGGAGLPLANVAPQATGTIVGVPPASISGVAIAGTAGQITGTFSGLVGGSTHIIISGTLGGTGTITGYANPTTYLVAASPAPTGTTATLQTLTGAAIVTTAGTPTGLTYSYTAAPGALSALPFNVIPTVPNDPTIGTVLNELVKVTITGAVVTATTDMVGIYGVVTGGAGTTGNAQVQSTGIVSLIIDNATTAGDYILNSYATAGNGRDSGLATCPVGGQQVIGQVTTTNVTGGTYLVQLGTFGCKTTFNPLNYSARCNGHGTDSAGFNLMANAVRAANGPNTIEAVPGPGCVITTPINFTRIPNNRTTTYRTQINLNLLAETNGSHTVDLTGSSYIDLNIDSYSPATGTGNGPPDIVVQFARMNSGTDSSYNTIRGNIRGYYSCAGLYMMADEVNRYDHLQIEADQTGAIAALVWDGQNHGCAGTGITSSFQSIGFSANTSLSMNDNFCATCNLENLAGGPAVWVANPEGLTLGDETYLLTNWTGTGSACVVMYNSGIGDFYGFKANMHCEATPASTFLLTGSNATPTIHGFEHDDYNLSTTGAVIALDTGLTSATIDDLDLHIDHRRTTPNVFDTAANYTLHDAKVWIPAIAMWSAPNAVSTYKIASPTTANISVTELNSGTGASSTTFWRGDGTWSTPGTLPAVTDVQTFTSSGTWTKPSGSPQNTRAFCVGGGGGGGGGADLASGTGMSGGGGGGGAAAIEQQLNTANLGATETVTIGAAGAVGTAGSTSAGGNGGLGGNSSFGSWFTAYGGGGGAGGQNGGNSGGGGGGGIQSSGNNSTSGTGGGAGSGIGAGAGGSGAAGASTTGFRAGSGGAGDATGAVGSNSGRADSGATGGGAGGGIATTPVALAGGAALTNQTSSTANAGGAANTIGTSATASTAAYIAAMGGGGGGSSITGAAGAGGAGARGGGGGGGGAALTVTATAGAGGLGGAGYCSIVTSY